MTAPLVTLVAARNRLGIHNSRFAKFLRLGLIRSEPNGRLDLERLARDYERACLYEARIASGEGLIFREDHEEAIEPI
jgi:hypothetical protein